jgi:hypothetical protein
MGLSYTSYARTSYAADQTSMAYWNFNMVGAGHNFGNNGGWSFSNAFNFYDGCYVRGICQTQTIQMSKYSTGDMAGIYGYLHFDGGNSGESDEGVSAATLEAVQNAGYFHGTVTAVTNGVPTFAYANVSNSRTQYSDGSFMIDTSRSIYAGNFTGTQGTVSFAPYLQTISTTGSLPMITAWAYCPSGISQPDVEANATVSVTITCTAEAINGGSTPSLAMNTLAWVAGNEFPERALITNVTTVGTTETVTLNVRNPNSIVTLIQGPTVNGYVSTDNDLAQSGGLVRPLYYAFGSVDGTNLIAQTNVQGSQVGGHGIAFQPFFWEASSGSGSGFHIYPGAEVTCVPDATQTGQPCLEQNSVPWAVGDTVENPQYPASTSNGVTVYMGRNTPCWPGQGCPVIRAAITGLAGGTSALEIDNYQTQQSLIQGTPGIEFRDGSGNLPQNILIDNATAVTSGMSSSNSFVSVRAWNSTNCYNWTAFNLPAGYLSFNTCTGRENASSFQASGLPPGCAQLPCGYSTAGTLMSAYTQGASTTGSSVTIDTPTANAQYQVCVNFISANGSATGTVYFNANYTNPRGNSMSAGPSGFGVNNSTTPQTACWIAAVKASTPLSVATSGSISGSPSYDWSYTATRLQ